MSTPLPPWNKVDSFRKAPHQALVDRSNELNPLTAQPAGIDVLRTPNGTTINDRRPRVVPGQLYRMQVTDALANDGVVLAQTLDGTTPDGVDVPVLAVQGHSVGDTLYAMVVQNDTDAIYGGTGETVRYLELLAPTPTPFRFRPLQTIDAVGHVGYDSNRFE